MKARSTKLLSGWAGVGAVMLMLCGPADAQFSFFGTRCLTDEESPPEERAPIERAATQFVLTLLGSDPAAAYSQLSAEAKPSLNRDELTTAARQVAQVVGARRDFRVAHIYLLKTLGVGDLPRLTICSSVAHGDTSTPKGRVFVSLKITPKQAYVLLQADSINTSWAFIVWLVADGAEWSVLQMHFVPVTVAGRYAENMWSLASDEAQRHHDFNSYMLSMSALELTRRGPNFHLGIEEEIRSQVARLKVPTALRGQPPFIWELGGESFHILKIGPTSVEGKLYLGITQELDSWRDDQEADRRNHELIAAFRAGYPESSAVFAGLMVESREHSASHRYRSFSKNQAAGEH